MNGVEKTGLHREVLPAKIGNTILVVSYEAVWPVFKHPLRSYFLSKVVVLSCSMNHHANYGTVLGS